MSKLFIVGIGPGGEKFLTMQAKSALDEAEVLCGYPLYISLIRHLYPHKQIITTGMRQEKERCRLALETAFFGKKTALICSGDAAVYGLASLVYELSVDFPNLIIELVPGISAAQSGGAVLGAPLSGDFALISLSDLLIPWIEIESRLISAAKTGFCIVIYNPASKGRPDYLCKACNILLNILPPETPCGFVRNIGRAGEESFVLSLAELACAKIDMLCTVFIGNSRSRLIATAQGTKFVTSRGYLQKVDNLSLNAKRLLIFGGTTEGRKLAQAAVLLGWKIDVCVASNYGKNILKSGIQRGDQHIQIHTGRLNASEIEKLVEKIQPLHIIDATHPYAAEITENIRTAVKKLNRSCIRLLRKNSALSLSSKRYDNVYKYTSIEEATPFLNKQDGNILSVTGIKDVMKYTKVEDFKNKLYFRVLPRSISIEACLNAGVLPSHIIAMQGPFSTDLNRALFRSYGVKTLVTKESGQEGGFIEKLEAAVLEGLAVAVIERPSYEEGFSYAEVYKLIGGSDE